MPAFPPLLGLEPRLLILGSMPGLRSLKEQRYYAHPRNAFWPIMIQLFKLDGSTSYEHYSRQLTDNRVCVWDVLHDCERPGSLDSRIVVNSEQPNDFAHFLQCNPSIETVGFNGQAARKIFHRHCKALYQQFDSICWVDLPSTSPAHASLSVPQKTEVWAHKLAAHVAL